MKDFTDKENCDIEHIRGQFKQQCIMYGFSFMDPSPIELLSVLETRSGPAIKDEIYHFKDKGDRDVALRFDFTIGLTRFASSQKSIRLPAKLSSFGGVFRYDEPQRGRFRYFHQWDIEIYGKPNIESDAEIIEFSSRLFDSLRLKNITIEINHRKLVESFIKKTFDSSEPQLVGDMLRAIDKIQKKSEQEILDEFKNKYQLFYLEKILEFAKMRGTINEIEQIFDVTNLEGWNELKNLMDSLRNRGVSNVKINFGIVRGLDYYSGMVFEVFASDSTLGSLAGGGRYDILTEAFGRNDIGAAGVAGGVERIILTMQEQKINYESQTQKISVLYVNEDTQKTAIRIASMLRQFDIPTNIDLSGRNLKKQMEQSQDSIFCIIVAPKELEQNKVVLRNMNEGTEIQIEITKLVDDPISALNLKKL